MQYLPVRTALRILILLLFVFILFHLLILSGIIPYHIAWGGRLKTNAEMIRMETISILINCLMLIAGIIRLKYFIDKPSPPFLRVTFWIMFILFTLNTLGNLMAESLFEKAVFTPVTLILALLCLHIALDKTGNNKVLK